MPRRVCARVCIYITFKINQHINYTWGRGLFCSRFFDPDNDLLSFRVFNNHVPMVDSDVDLFSTYPVSSISIQRCADCRLGFLGGGSYLGDGGFFDGRLLVGNDGSSRILFVNPSLSSLKSAEGYAVVFLNWTRQVQYDVSIDTNHHICSLRTSFPWWSPSPQTVVRQFAKVVDRGALHTKVEVISLPVLPSREFLCQCHVKHVQYVCVGL